MPRPIPAAEPGAGGSTRRRSIEVKNQRRRWSMTSHKAASCQASSISEREGSPFRG